VTGNGQATTAWVYDDERPITHSFLMSMLGLAEHMVTNDTSVARGGFLPVRHGTGDISHARNNGVVRFLESDDEWLFWIDTDMGFDGDTVDRLVASADPTDRPVMGALCFVNHELASDGMGGKLTAPRPTVYLWAQNPDGRTGFVPLDDYPRDAVVQCQGTGSACIVIHRTVLETVRDRFGEEWYDRIADPTTPGVRFGEDMSFCIRLDRCGIPVHVNTSVRTTHLKPVWLSQLTFDMHRVFADSPAGAHLATEFTPPLVPAANRAERRRRARMAAQSWATP
jgi:hypothetical protein